MAKCIIVLFLFFLSSCRTTYTNTFPVSVKGYDGRIIDAHAQIGHRIGPDEVIKIIKLAGISKVIMSPTFNRHPKDIIKMSIDYPEIVIPAVRTKFPSFVDNNFLEWSEMIDKQVNSGRYNAMQELLGYHAHKIDRLGRDWGREVIVPPQDKRIKKAVEVSKTQGWPVILHYELGSLSTSKKEAFLKQLDVLFKEYENYPFVLTHLAQLGANEVESLITSYSNIYFTLAETTNIRRVGHGYPFRFVFEAGETGKLKKEWEQLFIKYPKRFILSIDGVIPDIWRKHYVKAVEEWRIALGKMPREVADYIAHGNAIRLWPVLQ